MPLNGHLLKYSVLKITQNRWIEFQMIAFQFCVSFKTLQACRKHFFVSLIATIKKKVFKNFVLVFPFVLFFLIAFCKIRYMWICTKTNNSKTI